jgi:hypothetical protein
MRERHAGLVEEVDLGPVDPEPHRHAGTRLSPGLHGQRSTFPDVDQHDAAATLRLHKHNRARDIALLDRAQKEVLRAHAAGGRCPSPTGTVRPRTMSPASLSPAIGSKFIGGSPMKLATKRLAGFSRTSRNVPTCCNRAFDMMATESAKAAASS